MRIIFIITFFNDEQIVDSKEMPNASSLQEIMDQSAKWLRQANSTQAAPYKAIDIRIERSIPGGD